MSQQLRVGNLFSSCSLSSWVAEQVRLLLHKHLCSLILNFCCDTYPIPLKLYFKLLLHIVTHIVICIPIWRPWTEATVSDLPRALSSAAVLPYGKLTAHHLVATLRKTGCTGVGQNNENCTHFFINMVLDHFCHQYSLNPSWKGFVQVFNSL
jgi:hypothetical protein